MLAGAAVSLAMNLPGHLSYDSILQLAQGRDGVYNTWHPPVMAWLLGVADRIARGAVLFVAFDTVLIFGAVLALILLGRRVSWFSTPLAALLAASPLMLLYPGIVWKDVLFAGCAVAGFACLAWTARLWSRRTPRILLLTASMLLLTLASLARQNGVVVLAFGALACGWIAARSEALSRRGWIHAGAFLAVGATIAIAASMALLARSDGQPETRYQWQELETYDIVGAIVLRPQIDLGVLREHAPRLETALRTRGRAAYSPARIDPLKAKEDLVRDRDQNAGPIDAQWRSIIIRDPLLYARVRAKALAWVFLTPDLRQCVPVYVGVEGPARVMRHLGLASREGSRDQALESYAWSFVGTPVFSHAAYAILALILLALLIRRRRVEDIAVAAMLTSAFAFTLTFFVVSVACDYRYLYFLDIAAMAAATYVVATGRGSGAGRTDQPSAQ